jgi:hypothetical protein
LAGQNKVEIEIILKGAAAAKDLKSFSQDAAHGLKEIKDQAKDAAKGLGDVGDATGGLGKKFDNLTVAAAATAVAFAAYKGLKDVVAFLKDCGEEAAGQELALTGLHTSLVANKRAYGDFEQQIIAQAEAMQKLTGFTDDAVESAAKILAPYDNITNDLFPRTIQATADLARALGIDLPSAAQMMGMASLGMTRGLKQIGIDIDDATFKTIGFAGVLEQVEEKVKGQAAAYRATSKGLSDFIKTMWGEVKEQFGTIVNQVLDPFKKAAGEVLTVLADKLGEWVKTVDLKKWAEDAAKSFKAMVEDYIPKLIDLLSTLPDKIKSGLEGAKQTLDDIKKRFEGVVLTVKLSIDALKLFWDVMSGQWVKTPGDFKKAYDDLAKGIDDIKVANKKAMETAAADVEKAADEIKDEPITPTVDDAEIKKALEATYAGWAGLKRKIESDPIYVKVVYQDTGATEYKTKEQLGGLIRRQWGGAIPGFGGGDKVPAMLEAGEFVMRKEAVRSLGVDMLNAMNRGGGGPQGYFVLDLRGGGKSYPLTVQKDDTADALLKALERKELIGG